MGSSSSKFRKHLQHGDEYAALHLLQNNSDLRKALDPNLSYGDHHNHDTPLHLAARHGMKALLRIFLKEYQANPNKNNIHNESALHSVCQAAACTNLVFHQKRAECLSLILQWRGPVLENGEEEKVDLGAQDEKDNTALHYAASSGLKQCVELLVLKNAPLFTENDLKQTPCDSAEKSGNGDIALYLESKMVFSGEEENPDDLEMVTILDQMESEEAYSGLRAQDLQEAKDQLLVETSDMLRIPLFTAEALLRNHEWSRESLLEAWMDNPVTCCEKSGVVPPGSLLYDEAAVTAETSVKPTQSEVVMSRQVSNVGEPPPVTNDCDICACEISTSDEPVQVSCDHQFCRPCWERYLTIKIQEGDAHNIICPGFGCSKLVPVDVIETLVSRDMARRYLQFDIKAFVESNPSIKWCPYPGCGRAVRLPESDNPLSPSFRGLMDPNMTKDFSHAVDCGNGHIFCWECIGEPHEPASCENWQKWYQKIAEIKPEQLSNTEVETEMTANMLWLVTNSKVCPNCKSPIQKNEGCNHMKCSKCKHDFCWVCMEPWKRHSSATGGYFRCNRYEVVKKVQDGAESSKAEATAKNKKMQELNRFVHYYTRFKNHENSFRLEEPLATTAKEKMMVLAKAVTDPDTANMETKFVEDAVQQLLKARRVLKCSYVYGFYLLETGYKKPIFEFMQTELEECTEILSEMIARPYLRTPRSKIIQTSHLVQRKRQEFVTAISKGLVPPDTSPNAKRKKGRYNVELDDDLRKALMASLSNIDPANPWVKDPSGKHTNVSALLDWPEEEDESDAEPDTTAVSSQASVSLSSSPQEGEVEREGEVAGGVATCVREGCNKPRAQNPRTGEVHDHCSMKCLQSQKNVLNKDKPNTDEALTDYHIDLLRALEMSRLQFLREMGQLRPGSVSSESHSPLTPRTPRSPNPSITSATDGPSTSSGNNTTATAAVAEVYHPPVQRRARIKSEPGERSEGRGGPKTNAAEGEGEPTATTDVDLQRAMEMSRLSLQDEERDLRLAIELSLKDSLSDPKVELLQHQQAPRVDNAPDSIAHHHHQPIPPPVGHQGQSKSEEKLHYTSRNPDYSSIVNRVPNCSVEDLAQDAADLQLEILGGACGGCLPSSPKQRSPKASVPPPVSSVAPSAAAIQKLNTFGLIKDISVTNINISDVDKTRAFEDKVLTSLFVKEGSSSSGGGGSGDHSIFYKANIGRHSAKAHGGETAAPLFYGENSSEDNCSQALGATHNYYVGEKGSTRRGHHNMSKSQVVMTNQNNLDKGQGRSGGGGGGAGFTEKRETSSAYDASFYMKKVENVEYNSSANSSSSAGQMSQQSPAVKKSSNTNLDTPKKWKHRGPPRRSVEATEESTTSFSTTSTATLNNSESTGGEGGLTKAREVRPHGADLDPDDLHIDSVMLESMISGVDEFSPSHRSNPSPTETNMDNLVEDYSEVVVVNPITMASSAGNIATLAEEEASRPLLLNSERNNMTNNNLQHNTGMSGMIAEIDRETSGGTSSSASSSNNLDRSEGRLVICEESQDDPPREEGAEDWNRDAVFV